MHRLPSRAAYWTLALTSIVTTLAACADESTSPTPHLARTPNPVVAAGDDVVVVTSTSGGTGVGTIRWAAQNVKSYGVIRFDSSLAGATITVDSTIIVNVQSATIEGPKPRGVTLSGGGLVRVLQFGEFGYVKNVSITRGVHAVAGGGIYAPQGVLFQNGTVSYNSAPTGGGIYGGSVGLFNATVARNTSTIDGSAVSYSAYNSGVSLYNSTVAENGPAAGIVSRGSPGLNGMTILNNSIIAKNGTPLRNCVDLYNVTYEGGNIADDASCGGYDKLLIANPLLGELADRGGPGQTMSFARESPALDGGSPIQPAPGTTCAVYTDQRYVARDSTCDVGAFEFTDFTRVTLTIDQGATVDPAIGTAVVSGTMRCTHAGGQFGVIVQLQQQKGGKTPTLVKGSGGAGVTCTTTTQTWRATITPESGAFDTGNGSATAMTNDSPIWIKRATTSAAVKLRK